ncbi:MAG: riboflavin biosynthesis protein RibF [Lachnospiraceae bacterium]|nr:riboflavin biosynthesis protein RibF [Lachnospiraceae bacterium]
METISDLEELSCPEGSYVTVGKFDGLHLGHRELIGGVLKARDKGHKAVVIRLKIEKQQGESLLTEKETGDILEALGVDILAEIPLTEAFRDMPAETFIKDILAEKLQMKAFFCGEDFFFGKDRRGNIRLLEDLSAVYGFTLHVLPKKNGGAEAVSSSRIRTLLSDGAMHAVNALLGYRYFLEGEVVHGRHLATYLGFPTANVVPPAEKLLPPFGVYAVLAETGGKVYEGMANLGVKPTVTDEKAVLLEVSLSGFSGNLYGKTLRTEFLEYIRPEKRFDSVDDLKHQLNLDFDGIRDFFHEKRGKETEC